MILKMFNIWYFFWILVSVGSCIGLYYLLRTKSEKTQKIVLWSILAFALLLHFLKLFIPPYSTTVSVKYSESWFVNICGANIFLFPIIFLTKNKYLKDYMFYMGVISGILTILIPIEAVQKVSQAEELLDIIRFYIHHTIIWIVPLNMVLFRLHTIDWRRVWCVPACLLGVMLFIMVNQVLQSELGFIPLRNNDLLGIGYKNSSLIWGPGEEGLAKIFTWACPDVFKTIPVGEMAGQPKYWPWFWLICPLFIILTPICFAISLIFDFVGFKLNMKWLFERIGNKFAKKQLSDEEYEELYGNIPEKYRPKRKVKKVESKNTTNYTEL